MSTKVQSLANPSAEPHHSIGSAYTEVVLARQKEIRQTETLAQLHREISAIDAEIENLVEAERGDAAKRILDGEASAPPKPRRVKKIGELKARKTDLQDAIPLAGERLAKAASDKEGVELSFANSVLQNLTSERTMLVAQIQQDVAALIPHLAALAATDLVQENLIGEGFAFNCQVDLFSGQFVANKFLSALPPRLMPPGVSLEALHGEARQLASTSLAQTKGL